MSEKLQRLLEKANEKALQKTEDGTVADLGLAPTGHIVNDKIEEETDE